MTTPEITRIRAALAAWNDADNGRREDAALDLLHHAVGPEQITAVMAHIDAMQAEIERLNTDRRVLQAAGEHPAPCARHCEAQAFKIEIRGLQAEIERLRADAARYRWLRHGDNDSDVLQEDSSGNAYLPRKEHLDSAIDAAMAPPRRLSAMKGSTP